MGENHKEDIMKCLKDWHSVTLMQGKALSEDNIEVFEKLTKVSVILQSRLDDLLTKIRPGKPDKKNIELLKIIQKLQDEHIQSLTRGVKELSQEIIALNKNKSSVRGYRQNKSASPRFKSERA